MTPIYWYAFKFLEKIPGIHNLRVSFAEWIIEQVDSEELSSATPAVYALVGEYLRREKRESANQLVRKLIWSVRASTSNQFMRDIGINLHCHQLSAIYERYEVELPEYLLELFEQLLGSYGVEFSGEIDRLSHSELRALSETLREEHLSPRFSEA